MNIKDLVSKSKQKIQEIDERHPWIKYAIFAGGGYALYRIGLSSGCKITADEGVKYIKNNYPKAYDIIVGNDIGNSKRTSDDILNDLKKIWGENWQKNMEIISNYQFKYDRDAIPQSQIDASNNLVWELNRLLGGNE